MTLCSSRRTVLVETGESRCRFNSAVILAAVVSGFLDTIWVRTRTSLSDSFLLRRQLLRLDVVRPSRRYAVITLDTVALDTSHRLAVLLTDAPARRAPTICPLLNSDMSPIMSVVWTAVFYVQLCFCSPNVTSDDYTWVGKLQRYTG